MCFYSLRESYLVWGAGVTPSLHLVEASRLEDVTIKDFRFLALIRRAPLEPIRSQAATSTYPREKKQSAKRWFRHSALAPNYLDRFTAGRWPQKSLLSRPHSVLLTLGSSIFLPGPIDYRLPLAGLVSELNNGNSASYFYDLRRLCALTSRNVLTYSEDPGLQTRRPSLKGSFCD